MSMSFTAFERSIDLVKFGDHFNLRRRTELIVMLADKGIVLGALSVTVLRESPPTHAPHSTVTDLARFRGLSISVPRASAA
jgi:hypothetical protein